MNNMKYSCTWSPCKLNPLSILLPLYPTDVCKNSNKRSPKATTLCHRFAEKICPPPPSSHQHPNMNRFSCNSLLSEWELSKTKCEYYRSYQISNSYYRLQLWWQWCWWSSVEQSDKLVKLVCKSKTAAELAPELVSNWLPSPAMRINYKAGVDNAKSTTYPNIFLLSSKIARTSLSLPLLFCSLLLLFSYI